MLQLDDLAAAETKSDRSMRWATAARVAAAVFLAGVAAIIGARWLTGTGYVAAPPGLPDAGQLTAIGLPITHLAGEAAAVVVSGLLMMMWMAPKRVSSANDRRLAVLASRWSWVWAGSALAWMVFTMSDMTGLPVTQLPSSPDLIVVVSGTQRILAQMATLWIAVAVALFAGRLSGRVATVTVSCLVLLALLPSALSGHAGHHNETAVTVGALAIHIVAAALWIGGLLAIVMYLRHEPDRLVAVLPRFSTIALLCAASVAVSGVIVSVVLLGSWAALLDSNRGHLIAAKGAALALLVMIGYWHRRTSMVSAAGGRLRPLLRLAGVELLLMGATMGVAVALSTTA